MPQGNKVLFLCVVCVDAVYLPCFQGVALFLVVISVVFHRVYNVGHLPCAADVCFGHEGVSVGTGHEVFCSLDPYPKLDIG